MAAIKILLLVGVAVVGLVAFRGARSSMHTAVWRLLGLGLVAAMAMGVIVPDAVTWAARLVGVGRGADLVLYVTVIAFLLVTVMLARRLSDLERRYIRLARRHSILEARLVSPAHENDPGLNLTDGGDQ